MTRWHAASASDVGLVRDANEDAVHVDSRLAVVADGMGGHAAGEVASAIAVEVVVEAFHDDETVEGLTRAVDAANQAVLADAKQNPERFGMGTTLIAVGLTLDGDGVVAPTLVNVGDSRAYQLRDGALRQLSEDHSVAEEWVRLGRLTPEEAAVHPRRHQLTRVLGADERLEVDVTSLDVQAGDRVLLCSDGLSNELSADEIASLASAPIPLEDAVSSLVAAARAHGGHDNISVVLVEFSEAQRTAVPVQRTVATAPPPRSATRTEVRPRRVATWRVGVAFAILIGVAVGFVAIMRWYAYSGYYLGADQGVVAIYRGQPGGVLWFRPTRVLDTTYPLAHLLPADRQLIARSISEPSLQAALNYADFLHRSWLMSRPVATTTLPPVVVVPSTTTTLRSATTTTHAKAKG